MADVAVGDIFQWQASYTLFDQRCLLVRHYRMTTAVTTMTTTFVYNLILNNTKQGGIDSIVTPMIDCMSRDVTIDWIQVQKVSPQRYRGLRLAIGLQGQVDADALPSNSAMTITLGTEQVGRGFSGSAHVGGVPRSDVTGDIISAGQLTLLDALGTQLRQKLHGTGGGLAFEPVTFRGPNSTNYRLIEVSIARSDVRVMRRRTLGVGQ